MYTVFASGVPKRNRFGLTIFVRTLAEARREMVIGDSVTQWSNGGNARAAWVMNSRGCLTKVRGKA